jgi:hypothetical protein
MRVSINKSRALAQMSNKGILTIGSTVEIFEYMAGEYNDRPNDMLICVHDGGTIRLPLKEYFKLTVQNAPLYIYDGEGDVVIHTKFKITGIKDRVDMDGDIMYPHAAYNGFEYEEPEDGTYEWTDLKNSGINPSWSWGCLKDYTVEVIGYTVDNE